MGIALAKDALALKIDLLSNIDTMDRAIRFVKSKKDRLRELQEEEEYHQQLPVPEESQRQEVVAS